MTRITPEAKIGFHEDIITSLMNVIKDLRHEIEGLKDKAKTGGEFDGKAMSAVLTEFNRAVLVCTTTETKLNECRNKQAGIARGGYALDLGALRAEIGGKLDKLRRGSPADGIPE